MPIKQMKVDGKDATVAYIKPDKDGRFQIVDEDQATLVKVIYDDGSIEFLAPEKPEKR